MTIWGLGFLRWGYEDSMICRGLHQGAEFCPVLIDSQHLLTQHYVCSVLAP